MERETVIATMHSELSVADELRIVLGRFPGEWFAGDEGGDRLLAEFSGDWNAIYVEVLQRFYDEYFLGLGLPKGSLPKVKLVDSRRGSWVMEAALVFLMTVGATYHVLKGLSELPKIADGLEETKNKIKKELQIRFRKKAQERIEPFISQLPEIEPNVPRKIPPKPFNVSFSIDARPIRGLTPEVIKSHSIHLSVGISRSSISIENLGSAKMINIQIGLFKSTSPLHNWHFAEAYSKMLPLLSAGQTIVLSISDFHSQAGVQLDLGDDTPLHVDCWIQDLSGIYLFNFLLE